MTVDQEKLVVVQVDEADVEAFQAGHDPKRTQKFGLGRITRKLLTWGVETRGERSIVHVLYLELSAEYNGMAR